MFRIRKIHDAVSPANRDAIEQVRVIIRAQFPRARDEDLDKVEQQLRDPLHFRYRSVLFVVENARGQVRGFAMLLHLTDLNVAFLELISTAPETGGGGIGGVLYETVREEVDALGVVALFFECSVDDPKVIVDPVQLRDNQSRLRFYERYGARPILNNAYDSPVFPGDTDLYFLMVDGLGRAQPLRRTLLRKVVSAILERKYGTLIAAAEIARIAHSFVDDPPQLRAPRYAARSADPVPVRRIDADKGIALLVNDGHDIHHVRDRGYVEVPVRIPAILDELNKTRLFTRIEPRHTPEILIKRVHAADYVDYLREACAHLPAGKSIYPIIFPVRNQTRPPRDLELRLGYYCTDTFTPLHRNVWPAARGAVDCAVTGARALFEGFHLAYALVRPPGHHAERRVFGGFCYLNAAAVAAEYLSGFGQVAVLDLDYHHGNGTQDIFYERADVLTASIHGAPPTVYPHFAGFADETGAGAGAGANLNVPLPERISAETYGQALAQVLRRIREFGANYLVVALGLDTAQADPTGSWPLKPSDFFAIGERVGRLSLPTLVVQEGGYRTRTLGVNARAFFEGLWQGHHAHLPRPAPAQPVSAPSTKEPRQGGAPKTVTRSA
jgi:acetoin utilization deacetylase AcuC-like enzyme/GNAT superfamily N-acetyltransferase